MIFLPVLSPSPSGSKIKEGFPKIILKFFMAFAIRRRNPLPHPLMALISTHFLPHFFAFAIESYFLTYMKRILHLVSVKSITFKSSYNWFKIDIHQQLRPLTANYLAMFKVISTTICT